MVLTRRGACPAVLVPDEQAWVALGADPVGDGDLDPVRDAGRARRMVVAEAIPEPLAGALRDRIAELPSAVAPEPRPLPGLPGRAVGDLLAGDAHAGSPAPEGDGGHGHGHDGGHGDHGGHGHGHDGGHGDHGGHGDDGGHDMMEITGEPSADGLVMEPIELALGPLDSPLPAGLVLDVRLDGDVVGECRIRATLHNPPAGGGAPPPPDLLAPVAWSAAIAAAAGEPAGPWLRIAATELERATSHAAWARALGRLIAWPPLVAAATAVLEPVLEARHELGATTAVPGAAPADLAALDGLLATAAACADALLARCRSRRFATRTAGRGRVADPRSLTGPAARAAGIPRDARSEDPRYAELGFAPVTEGDGDARARALVRAREACASLALARAALARTGDRAAAPRTGAPLDGAITIEGPRGPLRALRDAGGWRLAAPGDQALRGAAAAAATGLEWASALVVIASFDLSPWSVGA